MGIIIPIPMDTDMNSDFLRAEMDADEWAEYCACSEARRERERD